MLSELRRESSGRFARARLSLEPSVASFDAKFLPNDQSAIQHPQSGLVARAWIGHIKSAQLEQRLASIFMAAIHAICATAIGDQFMRGTMIKTPPGKAGFYFAWRATPDLAAIARVRELAALHDHFVEVDCFR